MALVKHLKERGLDREVAFWGGMLGQMALQQKRHFDLVAYPPQSGSSHHYLARELAFAVIEKLVIGLEPVELGSAEIAAGQSVLVVDDTYCTGATLQKALAGFDPGLVWACILCRA